MPPPPPGHCLQSTESVSHTDSEDLEFWALEQELLNILRAPPAVDVGGRIWPQSGQKFRKCTVSIPPGHVLVMDASMLHAGAGSTLQHSQVEAGEQQRPVSRAESSGWRFGGHAYTSGFFAAGATVRPETTTVAENAVRGLCGVAPVRYMNQDDLTAWVREKMGLLQFGQEPAGRGAKKTKGH